MNYALLAQVGGVSVTVNPVNNPITPRCTKLCISGTVQNSMPTQRWATIRIKVPDALIWDTWELDGFEIDNDFDEPAPMLGYIFLDKDIVLNRSGVAGALKTFNLCGMVSERWHDNLPVEPTLTYKVYASFPTPFEPLLDEQTQALNIFVLPVHYIRNPDNPALSTSLTDQKAIFDAAPTAPYGFEPTNPNGVERYLVEKELRIDQNYEIVGGSNTHHTELIMRPDASIFIENGIDLKLYNVSIYACQTGWQGIDILQNGRLYALGIDVSHADTAISVMPGGKLEMFYNLNFQYNQFRGNYTSLKVRGNTAAQPVVSFYHTIVTGDGLRCSNTYNNCATPLLANQYVTTGANFAGVVNQQGVSNLIKLFAVQFRDLNFGVVSRSSNILLTSSSGAGFGHFTFFHDITPNAFGIGGTAILASGSATSTIRITGPGRYDGDVFSDNNTPFIRNAITGIDISGGTQLNMRNCFITDVDFGVRNEGGTNRSLYIMDNNITANINALLVNQSTGSITIRHNRFGLWDSQTTQNEDCYFGGNTISGGLGITDNVFHGNDENINLNTEANTNLSITENTFNPFSSQTAAGYSNLAFRQLVSNGNTSTMIGCNAFREQSDGNFANIGTGLYLRQSHPTEIRCNEFWDKNAAIHIVGQNTATNIIANRFNNMPIGIRMNNNANIGVQINTGNRWIGFPVCNTNNPPTNRGGKHFGTLFGNILYSQFQIDENLDGSYRPKVLTPNITPVDACTPGADWFKEFDLSNYFPTKDCSTTPCVGGTGSSQLSLTGSGITDRLGLDIATGRFTTSEYPTSQTWTAEYQLFGNLMRYPSFIDDAPELTQFVTDQTGRNIEAFYLIDRALQDIATPDSATQAQLQSLFDENNAFFDSLDVYLALITDSTTEVQYRPIVESLQAHINQNIATENTLLNAHAIVAEGIRHAAAQDNRDITPVNLAETNLRLMNMIRLEVIARSIDTFNQDELYNIYTVANQCPEEGGPAVFVARSLWKMYDSRTIFDDDAICGTQQQGNLRGLSDTDTRPILSVSPNPSRNTELTLTVNGNIPEGGTTVTIATLMGKEVQQAPIQFIGNSAILQPIALPQGAYLCTLTFANGRRISTLIQILY